MSTQKFDREQTRNADVASEDYVDLDELVDVEGDFGAHEAREYETTTRRFQLFQLLAANECSLEDIFLRLRDYYQFSQEDSSPGSQAFNHMRRKFLYDLQALRKAGYTVARRRRDGLLFYSLVEGTTLPLPFLFSDGELDTLVLLHTLFASPTTSPQADPSLPLPAQQPLHPFARDILTLIERLAASLPPRQQRQFSASVRKPFVYLNIDTVTNYLPHRAVIDTMVHAISLHRKIRFSYTPLHRSSTLHRQVDPYYITHQDGHLYLIGYSYNSFKSAFDRFYEYRIDRIDAESITMLRDPVDLERQRQPIVFRYWIDASFARGGLSNRWLSQEIEREEEVIVNGEPARRLLIRARAYSEFRIIQQLLKYGSKAELVDPPQLREKMRREVEKISQFYRSPNEESN